VGTMSERADRRSFWTTLPGILSGVAGLVGAVAAMVGALAAIGVLGGSDDPSGSAPPASFASVAVRYQVESTAAWTRFTELRVGEVPPDTLIELSCNGPACFRGTRKRYVPDGAESVFLTSMVPKSLRPGALLKVQITRARTVGKAVEYRIVRRAVPKRVVRCLPPGEAPVPC
jgi:hypothetical protein